MNQIAWDPIAVAAATGLIAAILYLREEAPRWCGFFAAATVVFVTAGIAPLLALAHHPLGPGLAALIVIVGAVASVLMFYLVVFKGHHSKSLIKRKGPSRDAGDGKVGAKAKSGKAPHHKAMLATVGVTAFMFLLVSNWTSVVQTGGGGISQTYNGITQ